MLKKNSIPWSIRQLHSMNEKRKLNFDIAIQRKGNIWDIQRKSLLIQSLLVGFPVPPMFAKFDGEVYFFIDGKQRITTVLSYLEDEFPLSEKTPNVDGVDIKNLKFSELSEEFQTILKKATFTITRFEHITSEEIEELFYRLNNGVSLKAIESTRVLLGTKNMKTVEKIANHPFFVEKTSISRNRYTDQESALYLVMLTKQTDTGLSSKELRSFVESYQKQPLESELIEVITDRLDFLDKAFDKKRKFLKKIHLPMVYCLVKRAMEKEISPEYFGLWADEFYKHLDKESSYYQACQAGSAKKENVQIRLKEIEKAFDQNFYAYENEVAVSQ